MQSEYLLSYIFCYAPYIAPLIPTQCKEQKRAHNPQKEAYNAENRCFTTRFGGGASRGANDNHAVAMKSLHGALRLPYFMHKSLKMQLLKNLHFNLKHKRRVKVSD